MSKTHTVRIEERRSETGVISHGVTVFEHTDAGDYSSSYEACSLDAARAMAGDMVDLLKRNCPTGSEIELLDMTAQGEAAVRG